MSISGSFQYIGSPEKQGEKTIPKDMYFTSICSAALEKTINYRFFKQLKYILKRERLVDNISQKHTDGYKVQI